MSDVNKSENDSDKSHKVKGDDYISIQSFIRDLTYNEIHLFWLGLFSGFVAVRPTARQSPSKWAKESMKWKQNQWYWKMGYISGYVLKAIVAGRFALSKLPEYLPMLAKYLPA